MHIDRDVKKYLLDDTASVADALKLLNGSGLQIAFIVSTKGILTGSFSDGDFRRWIILQTSIDLDCLIAKCMNTAVTYVSEEQENTEIASRLTERLKYLPVLNKLNQVVAVASRKKQSLSFGKLSVSKESPCFIIAEIGNNHNGDIVMAKKLVDLAIESGADCVKFQMRDMGSLYTNGGNAIDESQDLGSQYILDLLSRYQLNDNEFIELFDYCQQQNIIFLCTPFDEVSVDKLTEIGVRGFKVASADLTNHLLLKYLARKNLPLIISTGMSTDHEIKMAVDVLKSEGAQFILLHCNSTYPTPFKDIQLSYLTQLAKINEGLVGYSGHERGYNITLAAVALGAKVVEKHFTIDRDMLGNDHKVSLLPNEFAQMVQGIRQVEESMSSSGSRNVSQGEMMNRENLAKSVVAMNTIEEGQEITTEMLTVKSPGKGLAPYYLDDLVGRKAIRKINKDEFFYPSDLHQNKDFKPRYYQFNQAFGIPVRYHDAQLSTLSNFDMVEYHLSFQDLDLKPQKYVPIGSDLSLVVHAPELFGNDHTLDLASDCEEYRQLSIQYLNRVLEHARDLKKYYPKTQLIPVVVNIGGFSEHKFLASKDIPAKYLLVESSISQLDLSDIDLLIQTMPPFPWHFGGQRFHNLFVSPNEIATFCEKNNINVCLDVSHSVLACNQYDFNIDDFFTKLGRFTKHVHIADASGVDDEGLKIGDGEIDFKQIFQLMQRHCIKASWIPEIWQGHKNQGEGFWQAFNQLEKITKW